MLLRSWLDSLAGTKARHREPVPLKTPSVVLLAIPVALKANVPSIRLMTVLASRLMRQDSATGVEVILPQRYFPFE